MKKKKILLINTIYFHAQTLAELDRARQQLQQYKLEIENYEQQQTKAERVLQRLQSEYEAQIAVKYN